MVTIVALDPSLRGTGYAVLQAEGDRTTALAFGAVKNHAALSLPNCLVQIHQRIYELVTRFRPELCAVESVIFVQSLKTAVTLGSARGAALLAVAQHGLPIYEYPPRRVKQAVVGTGTAQKAQVGFMVRSMLGLTETPEPDAADAIAIGLTHLQAHRSPIRAFLPAKPL